MKTIARIARIFYLPFNAPSTPVMFVFNCSTLVQWCRIGVPCKEYDESAKRWMTVRVPHPQ